MPTADACIQPKIMQIFKSCFKKETSCLGSLSVLFRSLKTPQKWLPLPGPPSARYLRAPPPSLSTSSLPAFDERNQLLRVIKMLKKRALQNAPVMSGHKCHLEITFQPLGLLFFFPPFGNTPAFTNKGTRITLLSCVTPQGAEDGKVRVYSLWLVTPSCAWLNTPLISPSERFPWLNITEAHTHCTLPNSPPSWLAPPGTSGLHLPLDLRPILSPSPSVPG